MHRRPPTHFALRLAGLVMALLAASCSSADKPAAPGTAPDFVVLDSIHAWEKVDARELARMRSSTGPDGKVVYLHVPLCCDQFDKVYDADGRYLCAPSGGFTGRGDGRCPVWVRRLIWNHAPETSASSPNRASEKPLAGQSGA